MKKMKLLLLLLALPLAMSAQGDSWQTATPIESGKTVQGTFSETVHEAWYTFEVPEEGAFHIEARNRQFNFDWCQLYVMQNGELTSISTIDFADDDWKVVKTDVYDAAKGTFYIQLCLPLNNDADETFTLSYKFTRCPYANDAEPNDELGTGTLLPAGRTVAGRLGYQDYSTTDEGGSCPEDIYDGYRLEVPRDGDVTVTLTASDDLTIFEFEIYGWNGEEFVGRGEWVSDEDQNPESRVRRLHIPDAGAGTYYVHLLGGRGTFEGQGGYTLRCDFTPNYYPNDAEPNDDYEHAQLIKDGQKLTGHLGYQRSDHTIDFVDIYRMEVQNSLSLIYEPDTAHNVGLWYISLYRQEDDGSLTSIDRRFPDLAAARILQTNLEPGTYFVELNMGVGQGGDNDSRCGGYSLTFGEPVVAGDFPVRIHYYGASATRLFIPTPFDVTIENISDQPTESFFLAIPCSDDIMPLYADLPCDTGVVRCTMAELGGEEARCPTFFCPGLDPFESYTFTMYCCGTQLTIDDTPSPSYQAPRRIVGTGTVIAVATYAGKKVIDVVKDRTMTAFSNWLYNTVLPDAKITEIEEATGRSLEHLRKKKEEDNIPLQTIQSVGGDIRDELFDLVPGLSDAYSAADVVSKVGEVAPAIRTRFFWEFGREKAIHDALKDFESVDAEVGADQVVTSIDPNEMVGPAGYGDEHFIGQTQTVQYRILFENKAEATAPAYRIRITDVLDENVFDVSSVRFGSTSHDGIGYAWRMSREGNILSWDIEGIELPPNVEAPEGEGYVTFTVNLLPGLASGTQLQNQATIIFDYNEPIETNVYVNTLDLEAPTSQMLSAVAYEGKVHINCEGYDSLSGVARYKYYVSRNGEEFEYFGESFDSQYEYVLPENSDATKLRFFALATDNVGNTQSLHSVATSMATDRWALATSLPLPTSWLEAPPMMDRCNAPTSTPTVRWASATLSLSPTSWLAQSNVSALCNSPLQHLR